MKLPFELKNTNLGLRGSAESGSAVFYLSRTSKTIHNRFHLRMGVCLPATCVFWRTDLQVQILSRYANPIRLQVEVVVSTL